MNKREARVEALRLVIDCLYGDLNAGLGQPEPGTAILSVEDSKKVRAAVEVIIDQLYDKLRRATVA